MVEFKKHGANLSIRNIIIHQVIKEAGEKRGKIKAAGGVLKVSDKEQIFLGKLHKSYHNKSNPIYGIFAGTDKRFQNVLSNYVLKKETDFYEFSINALEIYNAIMNSTPTASGGFMILCEYTNVSTSSDLMLVLMINNKEGYVVNERDLTLQDIKNLDLSKVDLACLIDLTEWQTIELDGATERVTYLSFTKGKKNVSNYFLNFIDCDNKNTHTESTVRLLTALDAFSVEKDFSANERIKRREDVYDYCKRCSKDGNEVLLDNISALFYPEDVGLFKDFASDGEYKVSSVISVDNARMRLLKYVKYKSEEFSIEFDEELVVNRKISLDPRNRILIKEPPQYLIEKIKDIQGDAG